MGFSISMASEASVPALLNAARAEPSIDSPAMNELVRRYEPLVQRVARSLSSDAGLRDDLANGARWGVVRAVRAHDGRTEGFVGYMTKYMRGEARRALERSVATDLVVSPDRLPDQRDEPQTSNVLGSRLLGLLNESQRALVRARYEEDRTLADIAWTQGTSISAVSQRFGTIHRNLESHLRGRLAA